MNKSTLITIVRLAVLPLILFFYLSGGMFDVWFFAKFGKFIALVLFVAAAATSQLSGYIARAQNQVSDAGKMFGRIANRLLVIVGLLLVVTDFQILTEIYRPVGFYFLPMPVWLAVLAMFIALGRDIVIGCMRVFAVQKGVDVVPDKFGKAKNILLYTAISLLMFYAFADAFNFFDLGNISTVVQIYEFAAVFALSISTVVCAVSVATYLFNNRALYLGNKQKKDWDGNVKEEAK